jgi:hypothetical protein
MWELSESLRPMTANGRNNLDIEALLSFQDTMEGNSRFRDLLGNCWHVSVTFGNTIFPQLMVSGRENTTRSAACMRFVRRSFRDSFRRPLQGYEWSGARKMYNKFL